jgi:hypothetical protein
MSNCRSWTNRAGEENLRSEAVACSSVLLLGMIASMKGIIEMTKPHNNGFNVLVFLAEVGLGRKIVKFKPKQSFFSQGDPADAVFYLQMGRAKLTVFSKSGKEGQSAFSVSATSLERSL